MIYNRASADKTGQRVSVDSQDSENRAWCDREGWEVVGSVTDNDRSATRYATRAREGRQQIHDGVKSGRWGRVDVLVLWESSRGERGMDGHVELRNLCQRHKMHLAYRGRVLDMDDGDDRFTAGLDALLDEREAERARDRTLRSHRASVAARKPRGSVPFGYCRTYDQATRRMVEQVPDPVTAPVVQGIVSDLLAGATLYEIAKGLNARGVVTPQGERARRRGLDPVRNGWTSTIIRNLLGKQSLMGMRTHNGIPIGQGTWLPIVSPGDWRAVQALLAEPGRVAHAGGREPVWLCSGVVRCGVCQAWLRPMRRDGKMTYTCAGLTPTSSKGHVSRQAPLLDAFVTGHVLRRLSDRELVAGFARYAAKGVAKADEDAARLADLEARMATFVASAVTAKGIAAEAFTEAITGLAGEIEQLRAGMRRGAAMPVAVLELAGPDAVTRWNSPRVQADIGLRRQAVRVLLKVTVNRSAAPRGSRGFDRSSVDIVDLPDLPGPERT